MNESCLPEQKEDWENTSVILVYFIFSYLSVTDSTREVGQ